MAVALFGFDHKKTRSVFSTRFNSLDENGQSHFMGSEMYKSITRRLQRPCYYLDRGDLVRDRTTKPRSLQPRHFRQLIRALGCVYAALLLAGLVHRLALEPELRPPRRTPFRRANHWPPGSRWLSRVRRKVARRCERTKCPF